MKARLIEFLLAMVFLGDEKNPAETSLPWNLRHPFKNLRRSLTSERG
jgi:hypothetical protein